MVKIGVPAPSAADIWAYETRTLTALTGTPRTDLVGEDAAIWAATTRRLTDSTNLEDLVYTTKNVRIYPGLSGSVVCSSATTAWAWGAWKEIVPAGTITSDFIVLGLMIDPRYETDTREFILALGSGAAGAETENVVLGGFHLGGTAGITVKGWFHPLPIPRKFAANTRLAVKAADSAPTAYYYAVKVVFIELPLR